ncbi:hypothetical protein BDV12DRAFT_100260 [Aspergillus spectabilis]
MDPLSSCNLCRTSPGDFVQPIEAVMKWHLTNGAGLFRCLHSLHMKELQTDAVDLEIGDDEESFDFEVTALLLKIMNHFSMDGRNDSKLLRVLPPLHHRDDLNLVTSLYRRGCS